MSGTTIKMALFAILIACGGREDDTESNVANEESNVATEHSASGSNTRRRRNANPDWTVSYSGDLTGEFSGRLFVVTGTSTTTSFAAGSPIRPPAISGTLRIPEGQTGASGLSMFSMTLEDGTECTPVELRGEVDARPTRR